MSTSDQSNEVTYQLEWTDNQSWDYLFKVDGRGFYDTISPANAIADTCVVSVTPGGTDILAIDAAHVAAVQLQTDAIASDDTEVTFGLNVFDAVENGPSYYEGDEFQITVHHGSDDDAVKIENIPEGSLETEAYDPSELRADSFPEMDEPFETEATLSTVKVRGVLGAMADAHEIVRLRACDGKIEVEGLDDNGVENIWEVDANVTAAGAQEYSADYLANIIDGLWTGGETTVRFGDEQMLELETDGLHYALAPRIFMSEREGEDA